VQTPVVDIRNSSLFSFLSFFDNFSGLSSVIYLAVGL
jgi:hypothetical protein